MCVSPITIRSPKLKAGTFINGCDKVLLTVPCGHCPECQQKKTNDLLFRCYHEYLWTKSHGGFTLFQTLTYSDYNCPYSNGFRFFKKSDYQLFLKRLRRRMELDGYDVKGHIKYILTTEYGHTTHRPHAHICFFSTILNMTPNLLDKYIKDAWCNLGNSFSPTTSLGFIDNTSSILRVVNSIHGIRYVCKYIFKGSSVKDTVDFNKSSHFTKFVHEYCSRLEEPIKYDDLQSWHFSKIYTVYKGLFPEMAEFQLMPFHLQSKGLGLSFLDEIEDDFSLLLDTVTLPCNNPIGYTNISVPLYYIRKVFFNYDKVSKRFILNEKGKSLRIKTSLDVQKSLEQFINNTDKLYDDICMKITGYKFYDYVQKSLNNRPIKHFINYILYLKDRQQSFGFSFLGDDYFKGDISSYCEDYFRDMLEMSVSDSPKYFYIMRFSNQIDKKMYEVSMPLHNDLPAFIGYDVFYDTLQKIKAEVHKSKGIMIMLQYEKEKQESIAKSVLCPQNSLIY